jgi:hypothetical protein
MDRWVITSKAYLRKRHRIKPDVAFFYKDSSFEKGNPYPNIIPSLTILCDNNTVMVILIYKLN